MPGSRAECPASGTTTYSASGQALVQVIGAADRADDIVAALDDGTGELAQALDASKQLALGEEQPVHEVMRFDARNCQRDGVLVEVSDQLGVSQ